MTCNSYSLAGRTIDSLFSPRLVTKELNAQRVPFPTVLKYIREAVIEKFDLCFVLVMIE